MSWSCAKCESKMHAIDVRHHRDLKGDYYSRRRYKCLKCRHRVTTYEYAVEVPQQLPLFQGVTDGNPSK